MPQTILQYPQNKHNYSKYQTRCSEIQHIIADFTFNESKTRFLWYSIGSIKGVEPVSLSANAATLIFLFEITTYSNSSQFGLILILNTCLITIIYTFFKGVNNSTIQTSAKEKSASATRVELCRSCHFCSVDIIPICLTYWHPSWLSCHWTLAIDWAHERINVWVYSCVNILNVGRNEGQLVWLNLSITESLNCIWSVSRKSNNNEAHNAKNNPREHNRNSKWYDPPSVFETRFAKTK